MRRCSTSRATCVGAEPSKDPALRAKLPLEFRQLGAAVHADFDQIALDAGAKGLAWVAFPTGWRVVSYYSSYTLYLAFMLALWALQAARY